MANRILDYWQGHTFRGDLSYRKWRAIVVNVHSFSGLEGATFSEIASFINADWPEGEAHDKWLNDADVSEIGGWVAAGLY